MVDSQKPYTFDRVVRLTLSVAGAAAVFFLLRYLADVLVPFAAAAVLAYLLNPLVNAFEARLGRRWLAVGITLALTLVVGSALAVAVAVFSVQQFRALSGTLSELRMEIVGRGGESLSAALLGPAPAPPVPSADGAVHETFDEPAEPAEPSRARKEAGSAEPKSVLGIQELADGWVEFRASAATTPQRERIARLRERVSGTAIGRVIQEAIVYDKYDELAMDALRKLIRGGWGVVAAGVNLVLGVTVLIVVILYLVFLLLDYPIYAAAAKEAVPPQYRGQTIEFAREFEIAMRRYFRGQSLIALLTGVLTMIGFSIIGLPLAVPFGLLVGVLNMVPYLQAVAVLPALLLAVLRAVEQDASLTWSIGLVIIVFIVVQLIQDTLLTPRILAGTTGLRPVAIMLGIFIWGKLLGFLGLLLAIPLTCLGIAYYRRLVLQHAPETTRLETS